MYRNAAVTNVVCICAAVNVKLQAPIGIKTLVITPELIKIPQPADLPRRFALTANRYSHTEIAVIFRQIRRKLVIVKVKRSRKVHVLYAVRLQKPFLCELPDLIAQFFIV